MNAFYVRDTKLAAALSTFGVEPDYPLPMEKIHKHGEEPFFVFYFKPHDKFSDYCKAWESKVDSFGPPGHPMNSEAHPFWFIRTALRNRERFVEAMNHARTLHAKTVGNKTYIQTKPA